LYLGSSQFFQMIQLPRQKNEVLTSKIVKIDPNNSFSKVTIFDRNIISLSTETLFWFNIKEVMFWIRSASATRPSAGTPQFQNLSGAVRTVTSSVTSSGVSSNSSNNSNRSVTNLNGNVAPSPAYVSVSVMPRSVSGHNLNQVKIIWLWEILLFPNYHCFVFKFTLYGK